MTKEDIMYNFRCVNIKDKTTDEINKFFDGVPPVVDVQVIDSNRLLIKRESMLNRSGKYSEAVANLNSTMSNSIQGGAR